MATRSMVGILSEDKKSCKATYIHYDGYPQYTMEILNIWKKHNCLKSNINAIVNELGPASSLEIALYPNPNLPHNHKQGTQPGVMHFYNRDRGDNCALNGKYDVELVEGSDRINILFEGQYIDIEYAYIIDESGNIFVFEMNQYEEM